MIEPTVQYVDNLHVTINLINNQIPLDYDPNLIQSYVNQIKEVTNKFKPFNIKLKGLNHFNNAIFAQCYSEEIIRLHNALIQKIGTKYKQYEGINYVPHCTIVFNYKSLPVNLYKEVENNRNIDLGEHKVDEIYLTIWELPPKDIIKEKITIKLF